MEALSGLVFEMVQGADGFLGFIEAAGSLKAWSIRRIPSVRSLWQPHSLVRPAPASKPLPPTLLACELGMLRWFEHACALRWVERSTYESRGHQ